MENPNLQIVNADLGALEVVTRAARTCYASEDKDCVETREQFIKSIIARGHESVIEHCIINFKLSSVSRACVMQLIRHRMASYSQLSQRYVKMSEAKCVIPAAFAGVSSSLQDKVATHVKSSCELYMSLLNAGVRPEDARYVLPEGTETTIFFTYNLREVRHFLRMRLNKQAQKEIRLVAMQMFEQVREVYPWLVEDLESLYLENKQG